MSNANFVEVRFSDGKVLRAEGAHAKQVWDWLESCQTMSFVHGCKYPGEPMKVIQESTAEAR